MPARQMACPIRCFSARTLVLDDTLKDVVRPSDGSGRNERAESKTTGPRRRQFQGVFILNKSMCA